LWSKEDRKEWRKQVKAVRHKLLMHISLTDEEKAFVINHNVTANCGISRDGHVRHSIEKLDWEPLATPAVFEKYKGQFLPGFYIFENRVLDDEQWTYEEGVIELTDNKLVTVAFRNSLSGKCTFIRKTTCEDAKDLKSLKMTW